MSTHGRSDADLVASIHNVSRFCVEKPQVSLVLLVLTLLWGAAGFYGMPQRKDPDIPVRRAAILTPWPGNGAVKVEEQVTRRIEDAVAANAFVQTVESVSRTSLSVVFVDLDEGLADTATQFDDLGLKLNAIDDLPPGAGPVMYLKDFGDTSALMLTVASPPYSDLELEVRARPIQQAIQAERARRPKPGPGTPVTLVACWPQDDAPSLKQQGLDEVARQLAERGLVQHGRAWMGLGYMALDGVTTATDEQLLAAIDSFVAQRLQESEIHPDAWQPVVVRSPDEVLARLRSVNQDKYSYQELEEFTHKIEQALRAVPEATKVDRSGVLAESVYIVYSQERLASYGMQGPGLADLLRGRNIPGASGIQETGGQAVRLNTTGEFATVEEIADVAVGQAGGSPVYLRDLAEVFRSYEAPPSFLNFYTWKDEAGNWHRSRAVTLAVQMRAGRQIAEFGEAVDEALARVLAQLPSDLVVRRTSDQPRQVEESVELFNRSLVEAVVLVVIVSLVGFWEWRSALLMALAIPITLSMTYGLMWACGIDMQQVSVASLILALGLLVDDPVVAGDAIKHALAAGHPRPVAAWLGPTKLAKAIMYATVTNIAAYLPFLLLSGDTGRFLYSLPIVISCSLVASRLVSMSFIPFLGSHLLKAYPEPTLDERRRSGVTGFYYRVARSAVQHRWLVVAASLLFLAAGAAVFVRLPSQFFPKDLQYLSYIDLYLPKDKTLLATNTKAFEAEALVRKVAADLQPDLLQSVTTFLGGGGPRFWFSVDPELNQQNYAQLVIEVKDKHMTQALVDRLAPAMREGLTGARADVRQLDTGVPIKIPVAVRLTGDDIATLERLANQVKDLLRTIPEAREVRDDWGEEMLTLNVETRPDRLSMAGLSNADVARSIALALNGEQVSILREGDRKVPVVVKLRMGERAQLSDLKNLYVSSNGGQGPAVPLEQVAGLSMEMQVQSLVRRQFHRTVTVGCNPAEGVLASVVSDKAAPLLARFEASLPPGYTMEIAGEEAETQKGFAQLVIVMLVSMAAIYLALVMQFQNAVKPLLVFAAIPYGVSGAILGLAAMGSPFGFMAFLGVASLVGVIVSHVIVLFDYVEEMHEEGEGLEQSVLDAGIARLRPVFITVGATVIALVPLAQHGGPLWQPLCYTQAGGLLTATMITLVLVPCLYVIAVKDLRVIQWEGSMEPSVDPRAPEPVPVGAP